MSADGLVDITILGAGPVGLSAAYYAGHRDATVRIVESLEQLGGQVAATYPEKHVFDVAGHPKILGQKLVDMCAEQVAVPVGGGAGALVADGDFAGEEAGAEPPSTRTAQTGWISAQLPHTAFVVGSGSSWSHGLFAPRPSWSWLVG